jgi:hypothetical protein
MKARAVMHLLSRRRAVVTLLAGAGLVLPGGAARADHEYVAVITNTQLGPEGESGLIGKTLVVEKRSAFPEYLEGCNGVIMPAFQVQVAPDAGQREGGERNRLLMGIDPTYHPNPPAPTRVQPGDRFVVRDAGGGDCGDGTSLLYLHPAPTS